jgi:hypothetical protein
MVADAHGIAGPAERHVEADAIGQRRGRMEQGNGREGCGPKGACNGGAGSHRISPLEQFRLDGVWRISLAS